MKIIAFPPVRYVAARWEKRGEVQEGRSFFSGERISSAFGAVRVSASFVVSALGNDGAGAGYMLMLAEQMRYGVDLVRVKSPPINWRLGDITQGALRNSPIDWVDGAAPLDWESGGSPLQWFQSAVYTGTPGTDAKSFDIITVTGLPPNRRVARPSDFIRSYEADGESTVATAVTEAFSDASGVAVIRLNGPLPAGTISIGDFESRVFALDGPFPSAEQTVSGNWFYALNLIEVLPAEYGASEEFDPWT